MMKFRDVFGRCEEGSLSKLEAAELLGVNERTFRRWCRRYEEEGEAGLLDRRLGKPSPKRVPAAEAEEIETLYRSAIRASGPNTFMSTR
jgi:transposase